MIKQLRFHCRHALCEYELAGQLLGGEVGSTTMFAIPRGMGELALNEHFLQVRGM
jgi:hypothetical protein